MTGPNWGKFESKRVDIIMERNCEIFEILGQKMKSAVAETVKKANRL